MANWFFNLQLCCQARVEPRSESGAEKRERFSGTGRGLEERVTVVLSLGSIQGRDDPTHERELRPVRLVREFDLDASDVVHIFRALDV